MLGIAGAFKLIPKLTHDNQLERIKSRGELVVITRGSPTTYYEGAEGETGLEYDLASGFADYIGVKLRLVVADRFNEIIPSLIDEKVDLAAAGLTVTDERQQIIRFGPPYQEISQHIIYHRRHSKPEKLEDLYNSNIEIIAGTSHEENLKNLSQTHQDLHWTAIEDAESDQLLQLVWEKVIDYTIADSNELMIYQRFFPEIETAFEISKPQQLAWAFPQSDDSSLYDAANQYFEEIRKTGQLTQIIERHYGHTKDFDYVGTRRFLRHIKTRLKRYREFFENAGEKHSIDWKLLAAVGYQESHWNRRAVSPTGVRGIMMLTRDTAYQLGIKNRTNPKSSIFGGADYLSQMIARIDKEITDPDRTWMGLAAYNVGYYHLQDAREITAMRGGDPNKWIDVKESLPLLARRKWYKNTKHGYARGWEPVRYVENIRSYYDVLTWELAKESPAPTPEPDALHILPEVM